MQFANLHFDTYRTVNLLKERGYTKKQAEGFIEVMQEVTLSGVATKEGVQNVKEELKEDIQDVRSEIQEVKEELKQDIQDVRNELKEDIQQSRNESLKFQIIQTLTIIGVMVALAKIF